MESFIQLPQLFAIGLSAEALIISVSTEACRFLGYLADDLLLKPVTRILADDSAFETPQILDLARKQGFWQGGMMFLLQDGKATEARCDLLSMHSNGNHPGNYLLISRLNKASAAGTGELSELAEISSRLRAIAHDLNNPLTVVQGYVQLLLANSDCPLTIREDIKKIQSGLSWLTDTVNQLHNYAVSLGAKSLNGQTRAARLHPTCDENANAHF